jgi:hypothetical protein
LGSINSCYATYICAFLFQQGSQSVENYYQALQKDMIRCGLLKQHDAAMAPFCGGLNREIQDILNCKEFADKTTLFEYACKVEHEVQERRWKTYSNSFARRSSTSSSALALPEPSTPTTTTLESPAPSMATTTLLDRTTEPTGASSCANSKPSLHNAPKYPHPLKGNPKTG